MEGLIVLVLMGGLLWLYVWAFLTLGKKKNRNGWGWLFLSLFLGGPLLLCVLYALPVVEPDDEAGEVPS